jgi:hypothetical protein
MLSFFMQLNLCNYGLIKDILKFIFIEPLPTPIELCNRILTTKLKIVSWKHTWKAFKWRL